MSNEIVPRCPLTRSNADPTDPDAATHGAANVDPANAKKDHKTSPGGTTKTKGTKIAPNRLKTPKWTKKTGNENIGKNNRDWGAPKKNP